MPGELVAEGVGCARRGRTILEDVVLHARSGELVGVTGPSGSGKSTLLMLLAGLERPDRGRITLDGNPVGPGPALGFVLQSYGLLSLLTASENVEIALQAQRLPPAEVRGRSAEALGQLGLAEHAARLVDELSGGQQQRVAIARAIVTDPRLLLVDEPTAELDRENRTVVMTTIRNARRRGAIVVIATHDAAITAECTSIVQLPPQRQDQLDLQQAAG